MTKTEKDSMSNRFVRARGFWLRQAGLFSLYTNKALSAPLPPDITVANLYVQRFSRPCPRDERSDAQCSGRGEIARNLITLDRERMRLRQSSCMKLTFQA